MRQETANSERPTALDGNNSGLRTEVDSDNETSRATRNYGLKVSASGAAWQSEGVSEKSCWLLICFWRPGRPAASYICGFFK